MSEYDDMSVLWKPATDHMTEYNISFDYIITILWLDYIVWLHDSEISTAIVELKIKKTM